MKTKPSIHVSDRPIRISIYVYPTQLEMIDEIALKRSKSRRRIFLEAVQTYIGSYIQGKI